MLMVSKEIQEQFIQKIQKSAILISLDKSGIITFANDEFCKIAGYSEQELMGSSFTVLQSRFHPSPKFKEWWQDTTNGLVWREEISICNKDGHLYWVDTMFMPLILENHQFQLVMLMFNTIEKKKNEKNLIQAAKKTTFNYFSMSIAHEINNPLTIIMGKLIQLNDHISNGIHNLDQINNYIKKIEYNSGRIAKIIKNITKNSYILVPEIKKETSLNEIIDNTLLNLNKRLKESTVQLKIMINLEHQIECCSYQITMALVNLVNNALDAAEKMPEQWVTLEVFSNSQINNVEFSVKDSGKRIKEDVIKKMMNPFYTTKEIGMGLGLGLNISKGIAEEHHGNLRYKEDSENTHFILSIPIKQNLNKFTK